MYKALTKQKELGDFLLNKKAAISKSLKKIMKAKDDCMLSKRKILLTKSSNGDTIPHLLMGNDDSLIFYVDLMCETKESNSLIFGTGLMKKSNCHHDIKRMNTTSGGIRCSQEE